MKEHELLSALDSEIAQAMTKCVIQLNDLDTDGDFGVTTMDKVVSVLSINHQAAIYALIAAVVETSDSGVDPLLRKYIDECVDDFATSLRANISRQLKQHLNHDILDPNAELRETILEISRHEI